MQCERCGEVVFRIYETVEGIAQFECYKCSKQNGRFMLLRLKP